MTDFPTPHVDHVAGLKLFRFIDVEQVNSLPSSQEIKLTDIGMPSGAVWYNGAASMRSISHADEQVSSPAGDYYSNRIALFYPGTSRDLEQLFDEMINKRFLIRTRDYQGNERLIGTLENPLEFTRSFSAAQLGGRKGYSLEFSNRQLRQSYFLNDIASPGAIMINDDGELEITETVPGHTFSLNANGELVVTGSYDYKFYLNERGEVIFDEFITP